MIVDAIESELERRVLDKVGHLCYRDEVHQRSRVDRIINAVLEVGARLASPHETAIFDVVRHEAAIVHDLCEPARKVDVVLHLRSVASKALSECESQAWPPALSATVHQVIHGCQQPLEAI